MCVHVSYLYLYRPVIVNTHSILDIHFGSLFVLFVHHVIFHLFFIYRRFVFVIFFPHSFCVVVFPSSFYLFFYFHAISRLLCSMLFVTFLCECFFLINTNEHKKNCNNHTLHRPQPQQIMKIIPALGVLPFH